MKEKKAYHSGLSDATKRAREAHWEKTSKMDTKDPRAYEPAPGDKTAKTKESKHTKAYRQKFGEELEMDDNILIDEEAGSALAKKAKASGVSLSTLRTVYKRGVAAWRTGHRPGTTPQQWGMARVNSYITKGKGTYHGADKDLREEESVARVHTFSEFLESLELGYTEEVFSIVENEEYEDWGEPEEEGYIFETAKACWTGYKKVGVKKGKSGKMVNDCVKEEAEHSGRKVKLGKPFLTPNGPKKRSVYVKNASGNVVKVNFGDPNMRIRKNNPAAKKSFRARHGCDVDPGPRWKAKYWSCKQW